MNKSFEADLMKPNADIPRLLDELKRGRERSNLVSDQNLWQADPFYEAAEVVQEDMDQLHKDLQSFQQEYHNLDPSALKDQQHNLEELCEGIETQVEEFEQVLRVTSKDPKRFHVSPDELERRRTFVTELAQQVGAVRAAAGQAPPRAEGAAAPAALEADAEGPEGEARAGALDSAGEAAPSQLPSIKKPSGVLLGDVGAGHVPAWERARREAASSAQGDAAPAAEYAGVMGGAAPPAYFVSAGTARSLQEELSYRYHEALRALANTDHYLLASFVLLVLGVFGLHTFYSHDESLI